MKSMTGFGRAKLEKNNRIYNIEIKSVNHKYSDISIKLPRSLSYLEEKLKKEINSNISRGKIDVYVSFENYSESDKKVIINTELVKEYMKQFEIIAKENHLAMNIPITEITKLPDVLTLKETEDDEEIIEKELLECMREAINNFIFMREQEGIKIKEDLKERINNVENEQQKISTYSTRLVQEYVVKLEERIKEILKTNIIDQSRLAMEVVLYADKCSVEEELTRLKSHISQFNKLIQEEGPIGKKIDFLLQEMNRETNTIGSKAGSLDITNLVVNIKTQLEDIREQIQNIE
ncbi:MAG: YicC family protein [Clostridiaceae bacterium]|nr:YicC family protein [Clostridiaceae bacterium]